MAKLFQPEPVWWFPQRRKRRGSVSVTVTSTAAGSFGSLFAVAGPIGDPPRDDVPVDDVPIGPQGGPVVTKAGTAAAALGRLTAAAAAAVSHTGAATAAFGGLSAAAAAHHTTALGGSGNVLNPQVYLVDRDTGALTPLAEWGTLQVSPVADAVGACSLAYPAGASGFDTLNANVGPTSNGTLDQEIEIRLVGSTIGRSRWLLQQKEGDDLTRGSLWTFTGVSLEQLLAEVLVGGSTDLTFSGVNAGQVLATVFDAVQARAAALLPDMTRDFTTGLDSTGAAWTHTVSDLKFGPTDSLLTVAQALNELGMAEFRVSPDHVLQAYNPDGRGTDRSTGAAPLRFAQGTNLAKADRRESARVGEAATAILAKGSEGVYEWVADATAEAVRGRRVETSYDAGQLTSSGAVTAAGQTKLDAIKYGVSERSHGIVFGAGTVIPGVDFDVADWALSFAGGQATRLRIAQWTLSFDSELGKASGTVTMNDVITDRVVALARQLNAQSRGGAVVGTSTAPALTDDGLAPHSPAGLTASSAAYRDADGATWASVSAAWSAVTTNADGTAADDIAGYLVQYQYDAGPFVPVGQVTTNAADWDNVIADRTISVRVAAVDYIGHVSDWSGSYTLSTAADATPPPTPSTPVVDNYIGILRIQWDGLGSAAEAMPPDFDRVEIYASQASTFVVGDAGVTKVGEIRGKQAYPWSPPGSLGDVDYDITWYVRLRSVDRSGNASPLSLAGSAVPGKVAEGDVASVNIGVLTAGIMNALMTVSGIISTGSAGESRVTLDDSGLYAFNDADEALLSYVIADQVLRLIGELIAGDPNGNCVVASPDVTPGSGTTRPGLIMYHDATAKHSVLYGRTNPGTSGGSRFWLANRSSATTNDGAVIYGDKDKVSINFYNGTTTDSNPAGSGGGFVAFPVGSASPLAQVDYLRTPTDSAAPNMQVGPDQVQLVYNSSNFFIADSTGSQVVSSGSVKSFVIDHPTDADRYLVHACTESPQAGVEYWGTAEIDDELAIVSLPAYFEALAEEAGRAVFLQPELITVATVIPRAHPRGDTAPPPAGVLRRPLVFSAMPSEVKGGQFHIIAPGAPSGARVHWQVKARRRDVTFEVEPLKSDVTVAGDGPYRFIVTDPA